MVSIKPSMCMPPERNMGRNAIRAEVSRLEMPKDGAKRAKSDTKAPMTTPTRGKKTITCFIFTLSQSAFGTGKTLYIEKLMHRLWKILFIFLLSEVGAGRRPPHIRRRLAVPIRS